MKALLRKVGVYVDRSQSIWCPFHEDGRKSAKYYEDSDEVFCFADTKTYRAYDVLKKLGVPDEKIITAIRQKVIEGKLPPEKKRQPQPLFLPGAEENLIHLRKLYIKGELSLREYVTLMQDKIVNTST